MIKDEQVFNESFKLSEVLSDFSEEDDNLFVEPYQKYLDKLRSQGKLQGHNKPAKKKRK